MVKFPRRMPKGRALIGPDVYGCSNTGHAPMLLHSRVMADNRTVARGYRFAIGPEIYVPQAVQKLIFGKLPQGRAYVEFGPSIRVTFCKTYETAKRRYAFLVKEREAENAKALKAHRSAARRARSKNPEIALAGILALSDYQ